MADNYLYGPTYFGEEKSTLEFPEYQTLVPNQTYIRDRFLSQRGNGHFLILREVIHPRRVFLHTKERRFEQIHELAVDLVTRIKKREIFTVQSEGIASKILNLSDDLLEKLTGENYMSLLRKEDEIQGHSFSFDINTHPIEVIGGIERVPHDIVSRSSYELESQFIFTCPKKIMPPKKTLDYILRKSFERAGLKCEISREILARAKTDFINAVYKTFDSEDKFELLQDITEEVLVSQCIEDLEEIERRTIPVKMLSVEELFKASILAINSGEIPPTKN